MPPPRPKQFDPYRDSDTQRDHLVSQSFHMRPGWMMTMMILLDESSYHHCHFQLGYSAVVSIVVIIVAVDLSFDCHCRFLGATYHGYSSFRPW